MIDNIKNAKNPAEVEKILNVTFGTEDEKTAFRVQNAKFLKELSDQYISQYIEELRQDNALEVVASKPAKTKVIAWQNPGPNSKPVESLTENNTESKQSICEVGEFILTDANEDGTPKPLEHGINAGKLNQWVIKADKQKGLTPLENLQSRYSIPDKVVPGQEFLIQGKGENMPFIQNKNESVVVYLNWGSNGELAPVTIGATDMINIKSMTDTYPVSLEYFNAHYVVQDNKKDI